MKELLEYIVKSIVNNPDSVVVEEKESVDFPGLMILSIQVAEDDKGIVIGRKGRTINAIRDLITINAIRNNKRVKVVLKDDNHQTEVKETPESQDPEDDSDIFGE
ncbi:MAG TPA: KH domain-containing protein [Candidatus Dojkabacteria bacterium]|nr:KH domain-containing protein [Candidatus Dojkabacteria bacterium]